MQCCWHKKTKTKTKTTTTTKKKTTVQIVHGNLFKMSGDAPLPDFVVGLSLVSYTVNQMLRKLDDFYV